MYKHHFPSLSGAELPCLFFFSAIFSDWVIGLSIQHCCAEAKRMWLSQEEYISRDAERHS
jgi:hypothetical protein